MIHHNQPAVNPQSTRTPIIIDGKVKYTVFRDRRNERGELQGTIHSNQIFNKPPGIALRLEAIDQAERAGAIFVVITHFETRDTYIAPLKLFREKGLARNFGYGDQLILPMGYWSINGQPPAVDAKPTPKPEPPVQPEKQPEPEAAQLALFGEVR